MRSECRRIAAHRVAESLPASTVEGHAVRTFSDKVRSRRGTTDAGVRVTCHATIKHFLLVNKDRVLSY